MPVQPVTTKQAEPKKAAQIDKSNAVNFHITDDALGIGESKARRKVFRLKRNSGGISKQSAPLRRLRERNRTATPEEQKILSQYVGWGGLADAFDESRSAWAGNTGN